MQYLLELLRGRALNFAYMNLELNMIHNASWIAVQVWNKNSWVWGFTAMLILGGGSPAFGKICLFDNWMLPYY